MAKQDIIRDKYFFVRLKKHCNLVQVHNNGSVIYHAINTNNLVFITDPLMSFEGHHTIESLEVTAHNLSTLIKYLCT